MSDPNDDPDEPPVKKIVLHATKAGEFSSDDEDEFYTEQVTNTPPRVKTQPDPSPKQQEEGGESSKKPRAQSKDKPKKENKTKTTQNKSPKGSGGENPSRGGPEKSSTAAAKKGIIKKGGNNNRIPKPRGRAPKNQVWDDVEGVWRPGTNLPAADLVGAAVEKKKNQIPKPQGGTPRDHTWDGTEGVSRQNASSSSFPAKRVASAERRKAENKKNKQIPKPRGRAPKDHTWDGVDGVWRPNAPGSLPSAKQVAPAGHRKIATATKSAPCKRSNPNDMSANIPPKRQATAPNPRASPPFVRQETSAASKAMKEEIVAIGVKDLWSNDKSVLLGALQKLVKFCEPETEDGEMCRQAVFECGAHMITIKTLERHPESKDLLEKGLELLLNMSISQFPMIENALLAMGAVEVVLGAMMKFPQDADVLTLSTGILGNLTNSRDNFSIIMRHAVKVLPLENQLLESPGNRTGEDTATEGPTGVEDGASVQQQDLAPRLPTTRLFAVIRDAQNRHKDSEKMQEAASFFLERCLCVGGTCAVDLLVETASGSLDALLASKKNFGQSNAILVSRVNSFFHELARLVTQGPEYLPLRGSGGNA
eukprot:scaffold7007_cov146-Amphora_coffeaeformis.AAC.7